MLNNKTEGRWPGVLPLPGDWLGLGCLAVNSCILHHFFFFPLLVKLLLNQEFLTLLPSLILPPSCCGGSKQMTVWCLATHWVKPTRIQKNHFQLAGQTDSDIITQVLEQNGTCSFEVQTIYLLWLMFR